MASQLRGLALLAAWSCWASSPAMATHLLAGFSAVEEGDDRQRPALAVKVGGEEFFGGLHVFGRRGAAHQQTTVTAAGGATWIVGKGSTGFMARAGGCLAVIQQALTDTISETTEAKTAINLGGVLGSGFFADLGALRMEMIWDAHLFPAGAATLFLVTARRQYLTFGVGVHL